MPIQSSGIGTFNLRRLKKIYQFSPGYCGCLLGTFLQSKRSPGCFPVRAHTWAAGLVPGQMYKRQTIDVSLSHPCFSPSFSPSLPLSLKIKNKIFKKYISSISLVVTGLFGFFYISFDVLIILGNWPVHLSFHIYLQYVQNIMVFLISAVFIIHLLNFFVSFFS